MTSTTDLPSPRLDVTETGRVIWRFADGATAPVIVGGEGPTKTKGKGDDQGDEERTRFEIPQDLASLEDDELQDLTEKAEAAFEVLKDNEAPTPDDVTAIRELAAAIKDLRAERTSRDEAAEQRRREFQAEVDAVAGDETDGENEDTADGDDGDVVDGDPADGGEDPAEGGQPAPAGEGTGDQPIEAIAASSGARRGRLVIEAPLKRRTLNPTLGEIAANAPDPGITDLRPEVVITAAADVPRMSPGQRIPTFDDLVEATINRAKALGVTNGAPTFVPLATLNREFPAVIDERMNPDAIRKAFEDLVTPHATRQGMEALVAAGGWCAPSEIRYEFFQISEVSGLWDVPTFGVRRGGLRWPQSLSLSDFFALSGAPASGIATNATMPWEWTEADDIAAITGSPTKLCLRPPCPDFDEARLELFGICVLAGNLTDTAFPELIRHFIAQVVIAHARAMNRRHLTIAALESTLTEPHHSGEDIAQQILGGYDLNATDYREKHGMRDTAVLEGVLPSWLRGAMRSGVAKQNGRELAAIDVQDALLMDWFDTRNIRMQWVQDWQTRDVATGIAPASGAIPTNWPTEVDGLLYAPGTFGRGNGMNLDLGVVRDSVLNAQNDHTAAWSEEATLIAKFGHESRRLHFTGLVASGHTGMQATQSGA